MSVSVSVPVSGVRLVVAIFNGSTTFIFPVFMYVYEFVRRYTIL